MALTESNIGMAIEKTTNPTTKAINSIKKGSANLDILFSL